MRGTLAQLRRDRLLRFAAGVGFLDACFYAVLAPLLPVLAREHHLTPAMAGLVSAGYPLGMLVGGVPAAVLIGRWGCRPTALLGLTVFMAASIVFPLAPSGQALVAARVVQGLGSVVAWTGTLAWVMSSARPGRAGATAGLVFGFAFFGYLCGPVLGVAADRVGRAPVFAILAFCAVCLVASAVQLGTPERVARLTARKMLGRLRSPEAATGASVLVVMGVASGALNALGPLLLTQRGATPLTVGAVFLTAYGIQALLAPAMGRWSDRLGPITPAVASVLASAPAIVLVPRVASAALACLLLMLSLSAVNALWTPGALLIGVGGDTRGDHVSGSNCQELWMRR